MHRGQESGFTLYELLIAMVIVGIILSYGIPNFAEFTQNSRLASTSNDLLGSFQVARSEAARSKNNITICASTDPLATTANCSGNFNNGWIIFVDIDGDLNRSGTGENILRAYPPVPSGVNVTTNAGSTYFSFAGTGLGRGDIGLTPALSTAMICDGRGIDVGPGGRATARRLVATAIGRATIISDHEVIQAAGGVCP
ncbi:MAG: GspH/FimT family pseudopilin [Woeseiaceae bacterium]